MKYDDEEIRDPISIGLVEFNMKSEIELQFSE